MLDFLFSNLCYLWFELFISSLVLQVFTFSQKISVNFQLLLRFIQGLSFLLAIAGLAVAVALTDLSIPDIFACILAFVPTGWGILSVSLSYLCYFHLSKPLSLSLSLVRKINVWGRIRIPKLCLNVSYSSCIEATIWIICTTDHEERLFLWFT